MTILVYSYLSRMARGDHQNDDDHFVDPPQRNRATGRRKEGDEVTVHTPAPLLPIYVIGWHLDLLQSSVMN